MASVLQELLLVAWTFREFLFVLCFMENLIPLLKKLSSVNKRANFGSIRLDARGWVSSCVGEQSVLK